MGQMKLNLLDATRSSVFVDVHHVCFLGLDDQPRHLLGIVEDNEDQRDGNFVVATLGGRRVDESVVATMAETVDISNEGSSDGSSNGDTTSVMPSEPLTASCWVMPDSHDFTIIKATVLFNLLWGTARITCLKPQIWKKHRGKIPLALRILHAEKLPGVA